jgi:hypothetical protein
MMRGVDCGLCAKSMWTLTRRANQGHNDNIADIVKPARRNPRRAFSFGFFESDDGLRIATPHLHARRSARRKRRRRPNHFHHRSAGARERAGPRRGANVSPPHAVPDK